MKDEKDDFDSADKQLPLHSPWSMLWRSRWRIALPTFVLGMAGFVAQRYWPYVYRSDALVLVEQQKIPESYVSTSVVISLEERLDQMTQQILSRTRLRRLIEQFHLFTRDSRATMDDRIERMRLATKVELVSGSGKGTALTAFRIRFTYSDPRMAQRVANELTSAFIDENLAARTEQSAGATSFFESELDHARQDLEGQEERLRTYKMRYIGELPEQLNSNLQMLGILQTQLRANTDSIDRAEQEKVYLETLVNEYRGLQKQFTTAARVREENTAAAAAGLSGVRQPGTSSKAAKAKTLQEMRQKLAELLTTDKPDHPDVKRQEALIAQTAAAKPEIDDDSTSAGPAPLMIGGAIAASPVNETAIVDTESRLKSIRVEIENHKRDAEALRKQFAALQQQINATPVREQQLSEVTRNYDNSRTNYQSLLQKKTQSELSTNLEKRQQGEHLRVLDPASLPKKPEDPTREEVILFGWAGGLCLGLGWAVLSELGDRRIWSEDELGRLADCGNLACLPVILTNAERRGAVWRQYAEIAWMILLVVASAGVGFETYWKA